MAVSVLSMSLRMHLCVSVRPQTHCHSEPCDIRASGDLGISAYYGLDVKFPIRLTCLYTWSPADGDILGGCGTF